MKQFIYLFVIVVFVFGCDSKEKDDQQDENLRNTKETLDNSNTNDLDIPDCYETKKKVDKIIEQYASDENLTYAEEGEKFVIFKIADCIGWFTKHRKEICSTFFEIEPCVGDSVYLYLFPGNVVDIRGISEHFFMLDDFILADLGIESGMSQEEVRINVGIPFAYSDDVLVYAMELDEYIAEMSMQDYIDNIKFIFKDDKLIAVWVIIQGVC